MASSKSSSSSSSSTNQRKRHSSRKKRERKHKDRKTHKSKRSSSDSKHNNNDDDSRKKRKIMQESSSKEDRKHHYDEDKQRRRSKEKDRRRKKHDSSREHNNDKSEKKRSSSKCNDKREKKRDKDTTNTTTLLPQGYDSLGKVSTTPPSEKIHKKDSYFSHNAHFRIYLYYKKGGIYFEDLTSQESHDLFHTFVKDYNNGGILEEMFYQSTIPMDLIDDCKRTKHNWKIRTNESERGVLDQVKTRVRNETEGSTSGGTHGNKVSFPTTTTTSKPISTSTAPNQFENKRQSKTKEERQKDHIASKRLRTHRKTVEEELTGGKADVGSHARSIQKRKEFSSKMHASSKHKEDAMGGIELNDQDIYGGREGFQAALEHEKHRKGKREDFKQKRMIELEKKEEDRKVAMMKMLGLGHLQPGQKIVIPPRND